MKNFNPNKLLEKWAYKINAISMPLEHMMDHNSRKILGALALEYDTGLGVFEFGTWRGLTTSYLAKLLNPLNVWTIELPDTDGCIDPSEIGMEFKEQNNVHQILANSMEWDWKNIIGDRKFDMVFVDGGHSEECVYNDSNIGESILRSGGIIILHDYDENNTPGVVDYVQSTDYEWNFIEKTNMVFRII